jgi:hypothetical protein
VELSQSGQRPEGDMGAKGAGVVVTVNKNVHPSPGTPELCIFKLININFRTTFLKRKKTKTKQKRKTKNKNKNKNYCYCAIHELEQSPC